MARKKDRLKETYYKAIRQAGEEPKRNYKKQWQLIRVRYKQEHKTVPNLYAYAKAYEAEQAVQQIYIPEIDFATDYLNKFYSDLETIYKDTLQYIDNNKEGTHDSGKLASIASYKLDLISREYYAILDELNTLISEYGKDVVAQAIADNVELDYTIAITLMPPSDVYVEFETTLEQLLGISSQLSARASQLAEEAESEYLGE